MPDDTSASLRTLDATGALAPDFVEALLTDPGLVVVIARFLLEENWPVLLEENWPASLHHEIAAEVGLDLDTGEALTITVSP